MLKFPIAMVVAMDDEHGIGAKGSIPWYDKNDFKWFKFLTTFPFVEGKKNALVMGKNTWLSLPKLLPNRLNVVVSSSGVESPTGDKSLFAQFRDMDDAMDFLKNSDEIGKVFFIGGSSIYTQGLRIEEVSEIYATSISGCYECDTLFPAASMRANNFVRYMTYQPKGIPITVNLHTRYNKSSLVHKDLNEFGVMVDK